LPDPSIDVDCLGEKAKNIFYGGDITIGYPTALACMKIVDSLGIDLMPLNIVVFGQGMLVGKPVKFLLEQRGLSVSTITRKTENKEELFKNADLVISATGQGKYITGDMIKKGAIIIDAGTSESDSGIVGDVDLESVASVASHVSPVPGGVGPVTVAMLLSNVLHVAQKK
jgi:methylenetetrahydrofolate dehydrogenase (NADP+)/methenyltetrahydrofolate cyclohydrolase